MSVGVDMVARDAARSAQDHAEAAHEAIGRYVGEVRQGFLRLEKMLAAHRLEHHANGNTSGVHDDDDDPRAEITANGTHVSIVAYRRLGARVEALEELTKIAKLEASGERKLVARWRRRAKLGLAIGTPLAAVIGWILHHLLMR